MCRRIKAMMAFAILVSAIGRGSRAWHKAPGASRTCPGFRPEALGRRRRRSCPGTRFPAGTRSCSARPGVCPAPGAGGGELRRTARDDVRPGASGPDRQLRCGPAAQAGSGGAEDHRVHPAPAHGHGRVAGDGRRDRGQRRGNPARHRAGPPVVSVVLLPLCALAMVNLAAALSGRSVVVAPRRVTGWPDWQRGGRAPTDVA